MLVGRQASAPARLPLASACRSAGTASGPASRRVPPLLGEHTADVLAELGYDDAAIKDLARAPCRPAIRRLNVDALGRRLRRHRRAQPPRAAERDEHRDGRGPAALLRRASRGTATARAVVFTGAGDKAFCVGGDLKEREGMTDETWRAQHVIFEQARRRACCAARCPSSPPSRASRMGGGCELAVLSDFDRGERDARCSRCPRSTRGIFPGIGGTQLLPRILGAPLAKEMIFTGRRMKRATRRRRSGSSTTWCRRARRGRRRSRSRRPSPTTGPSRCARRRRPSPRAARPISRRR